MEVVDDLLQSVKATVLDWPTNTVTGHDNLLRCSIEESLRIMLTHLTDDEHHECKKDTSSSTDQDALAANEDESKANDGNSKARINNHYSYNIYILAWEGGLILPLRWIPSTKTSV
jgi:hypothetical protein